MLYILYRATNTLGDVCTQPTALVDADYQSSSQYKTFSQVCDEFDGVFLLGSESEETNFTILSFNTLNPSYFRVYETEDLENFRIDSEGPLTMSGYFNFFDNKLLKSIAFESEAEVTFAGIDLRIADNAELTDVRITEAANMVEGDVPTVIEIIGSSKLETVSLAFSTQIGTLRISVTGIKEADMSSFTKMETVKLQSNDNLETVNFDGATSIDNLTISDNHQLKSVSLESLMGISGVIEVSNFETLNISMDNVVDISGSLVLNNFNTMESLNLPSLEIISGSISVTSDSTGFRYTQTFEALKNISGILELNYKVHEINLPSLEILNGAQLLISSDDLTTLDLVKLKGIYESEIQLQGDMLTQVDLLALQTMTDSTIELNGFSGNSQTMKLQFSELIAFDEFSKIVLHGESVLLSFGDNLQSFAGHVTLVDASEFQISFPKSGWSLDGDLSLSGLDLTINLDGLENIASKLEIIDVTLPSTINFTSLTNISGSLNVSANNVLDVITMTELKSVSGSITMSASASYVEIWSTDVSGFINFDGVIEMMKISNTYISKDGSVELRMKESTSSTISDVSVSGSLHVGDSIVQYFSIINSNIISDGRIELDEIEVVKLLDLRFLEIAGTLLIQTHGDLDDENDIDGFDNENDINELEIEVFNTSISETGIVEFRVNESVSLTIADVSVTGSLYVGGGATEYISISSTNITNGGSIELDEIEEVTLLDLRFQEIAGNLLIQIHGDLEELEIEFFNTFIADTGIVEFMVNESVSLTIADVSVSGSLYVGGDTTQYLSISNTDITNGGSIELKGIETVELLDLRFQEIAGTLLIQDLSGIDSLNLEVSSISGEVFYSKTTESTVTVESNVINLSGTLSLHDTHLSTVTLESLTTIEGGSLLINSSEAVELGIGALESMVNASFYMTEPQNGFLDLSLLHTFINSSMYINVEDSNTAQLIILGISSLPNGSSICASIKEGISCKFRFQGADDVDCSLCS